MNDNASQSAYPRKGCLAGWIFAFVVTPLLVAGLVFLVAIPWLRIRNEHAAQQLHNVAVALHNYHDTYRKFPASRYDSDDGTPRTSWRAMLISQQSKEQGVDAYDFNEAWDSEKNFPLSKRTPELFKSPLSDCSGGKTPFVVVVGERTIFPANRFLSFAATADGTANTIMVVADYENPVTWSEPVDLTLEQFLERYSGENADTLLHVAMIDSNVFAFREIPAAELQAMVERNDGIVVEFDEYLTDR